MGFWSTLLRYGGKAVKGTVGVAGKTTKTVGSAVLHPQRTLTGAGTALKTATVGGAMGYVGWEKLTTDKSVARIVSDAVIGEETTNDVVETANDVKDLKNKAGEAVDAVNNAMGDINSKWSGMSNFFRGIFSGNGVDMFGNFFSNLGKGNVSGLGVAGLVAAAFLVFGRFGWLGKIAGAMLGLMLIGNNSNISQLVGGNASNRRETDIARQQTEENAQSHGMKR